MSDVAVNTKDTKDTKPGREVVVSGRDVGGRSIGLKGSGTEDLTYNAGVEQRRRADRRFYRRGGRRPTDLRAFSPLVMVVESDGARRTITERLLATSHFAVAPVATVESALSICRGLAPSGVVCDEVDETRARAGLKPRAIPIVVTSAGSAARDR